MESKEETPTVPASIDESALLKPKPKREQTEKQKAVWAKAQQVRLDNAKAKREVAAKAREELNNKKKLKEEKHLAKSAKQLKAPKVVYESESEDEPEIIVVKRKKEKKVVYQEESSEDEKPAPLPREKKSVPAQIIPPQAPPLPIQIKPAIRFF